MNFNLPPDLAPVAAIAFAVFWIAILCVHIAFTLATYYDASLLNRRGTGTIFVSPFIWGLAVLIGGLVTVTIYWAMHHSELRRKAPVPGNPIPRTRKAPTAGQYSWSQDAGTQPKNTFGDYPVDSGPDPDAPQT
jgi:hypothetical protein